MFIVYAVKFMIYSSKENEKICAENSLTSYLNILYIKK